MESLAREKGYHARRASAGGMWLLAGRNGAAVRDRRGRAVFTTFAAITFLRSLPRA
jgi:hypothetical protein